MIFDTQQFLMSTLGGIIIGFAVTMMLLFNGRVTGISGIIYGVSKKEPSDTLWRIFFIAGLVCGGVILHLLSPQSLENTLNSSSLRLIAGGFLVGFGTLLGNGCTSGHGVCGISRFSLRSITATMTFIFFGALTVFIMQRWI